MSAKRNVDKQTRLMLRFQNGDESAFRSLLGSYKNRIYSLCYRYFQNQAIAEEACQDIFLRVYTSKASFQPEGAFRLWIFSLTNQVLQNHPAPTGMLAWEPVSRKNMRNQDTGMVEPQNTIRRAMSKLGHEERMAILLDHWEKCSIPEISEILNRNPLAVETVLFKARATLRIKLAAYIEPASAR